MSNLSRNTEQPTASGELADKLQNLLAKGDDAFVGQMMRLYGDIFVAALRTAPTPDNELLKEARDSALEEASHIAEQYEHAWGENNNPICGLIVADIRALRHSRAAINPPATAEGEKA